MSLKTAIRAKFRRSESGDNYVDSDSVEAKRKIAMSKKASLDSRDALLETFGTGLAPDTEDVEELRLFYENCLKEMQTQLLSATIENENLAEEVKELRDRKRVSQLEQEVKEERLRFEELFEKFKELEKTVDKSCEPVRLRRPNELGVTPQPSYDSLDGESDPDKSSLSEEEKKHRRLSELLAPTSPFAKRCCVSVWSWFTEFVHDVQHREDSPQADSEMIDEPLSPKRLKENITRLGKAMTPIWETVAGLRAVATWRWPSYTCFIFFLYMYALWCGWLIPLIVCAILVRLVINYLKFRRGWAINLHFLRTYELVDEQKTQDTGVAVQFNFIVHVARKCQNMSGVISDHLEKLKNLLTWQCPDITGLVLQVLIGFFILSICLTIERLFFLIGVYLGIKLFIIDCFFMRFPRIRRKYDTVYNIWQQLPTDAQLQTYSATKKVEKYILPQNDNSPDLPTSTSFDSSAVSSDDKTFCEVFSLPITECPLPSWKTGKRCAILNKDKSLPSAFKHGKLYLTRSFLCFERGKEKEKKSKKHIVIPLAQIKSIEKVKPFSWIPGSGMTISVTVAGMAKPLLFGVLMNRDDLFDGLMRTGRSAKMPWACNETDNDIETDPSLIEALSAALCDDSDSE